MSLNNTESLGLRTLARQTKLTDADWLNLITDRAKLIKPFLHEMTLRELGKISFQDNGQTIGSYHLHVTGPFGLETRCIIHTEGNNMSPVSRHARFIDPALPGNVVHSTERFWALTRSGAWILVTFTAMTRDTLDYKGRRARETIGDSLITEAADDPGTLFSRLEQNPRAIWFALGREIKNWRKRRQSLLEQSEHLARIVEMEEEISTLVQ